MSIYWHYLFGALLASTITTVVIMKLMLMRIRKKKLNDREEYIRTSGVYRVGLMVLSLLTAVTFSFAVLYYAILIEKLGSG